MDVWTHPASAALRDAADEVLAVTAVTLRACRAERKKSWSPRSGTRGSPGDSSPLSTALNVAPSLRRDAKTGAMAKHGSPRSSPLGVTRRRTPSPADFGLGPAVTATATSSVTAATVQLHKLDVRALQKKARAVGCDPEELAKVVAGVRSFGRDGDVGSLGYSPKHALIDLIQAKTGNPRQRASSTPAPTSATLHKMGVRALRQRARDLGVDEEKLTEVVEGRSPKRGLISLIEARSSSTVASEPQLEPETQLELAPEPDPEPASEPQPEAASSAHFSANRPQYMRPVEQPTPEDIRRQLEALPPRLLAALQAVETVDVDSYSHSSRSSNCTKQLRQLKQTYVADLLGALAKVETALDSAKAMSYIAQEDVPDLDRESTVVRSPATPCSRPLSLLETVAGELLGDHIIPTLSAVDLARLGQSCRTLHRLVCSSELAGVWKRHYSSRWESTPGSGAASAAPEYSHRANVELAWQFTRWVEMHTPQGLCPRPSTVATSAVLLQGPQHQVCAVGFDRERKNAATGDMDGVVRIWDIAQCLRGVKKLQNSNEMCNDGEVGTPRPHGRRSVGVDSGLGRNARLAVLRVHKKGHFLRWVAMHGRRLLCSCASATHSNSGDSAGLAPGRLVLVDLDDLERQQNNSMLTKGVAAAAIDTSCGFIGTGLRGERVCVGQDVSNGFPVHTAWAGVGGTLARFDLRLDQADRVPAPAPLPPVSSVVITTHYEDTVDAAIPLLGLRDLGYQTAAVATAAGAVCTVDLDENEPTALNGVDVRNDDDENDAENGHIDSGDDEDADETADRRPRAHRILRRWPAPANADGALTLGHSALAVVPSVGALVASWYPHEALLLSDRQFGTLRVLDPRQEKPIAYIGAAELCPPIEDLFAPPGSSTPMVLAMLCSGETRSIDLRMLGRSFCQQSQIDRGTETGFADGTSGTQAKLCRIEPQNWPVVKAASDGSAESLAYMPRRLSGGSTTLLATVEGGALLGEFDMMAKGGCHQEDGDKQDWEPGRHQTPSGKERKERKDKKGSKRGEAVNNGRRRFPKKNNRRKQ